MATDAREKSTVILYHAECTDGFGGAYAAWKKFGDEAVYIPVAHRNPPPRDLHGKDVYCVDFTYPEDVIQGLMKKVRTITVLDHHAMMEPAGRKATSSVFSQDNSGAVLSWEYFHPKTPVPLLLRYIEDDDLWRFVLPNTRSLISVVHTIPHDFMLWDDLAAQCEDAKQRALLVEHGNIMVEYNNQMIQKFVNLAEEVVFEGYVVRAVNAGSMLTSGIGAALATKYPPFGIVWYYRRGGVSVSLRGNGDVDCAQLAARYGGGGHRNSAGFSFRIVLPFPFKKVQKSPEEE